ncbi:hypothetical protein DPMN_165655 [Dreissena polymorpha]|uniref:Uncharacterized protein n=1 Tax=Dreissena polymorpha TaxID=45954 RepID=A0A9D4EX96_DREPO|nr:hypothetical protein DPMN_165655 [Dreissena polymorpha]
MSTRRVSEVSRVRVPDWLHYFHHPAIMAPNGGSWRGQFSIELSRGFVEISNSIFSVSNSRTDSNLAWENVRVPKVRLVQSEEHSPCKQCVPGSSPGLAAHFSPSGDNKKY